MEQVSVFQFQRRSRTGLTLGVGFGIAELRLRILAVGQKMPSWVQAGFDDYARRIRSMLSMELVEIPLAKRSKKADEARYRQEEGENLRRRLRESERVLVLDVKGKPLATEMLATSLLDWQMEGTDIALIIGGPDGLDSGFLGGTYPTWSLSELTLPHPLVRLIVVEQIYRALSINANHPYHRQ